MGKKRKYLNILLVLLVVALDFFLGPGILYLTKIHGGPVYRLGQAGSHPLAFLFQSLMLSLWPIVLWAVFKGRLKQNFGKAMGLKLTGPFQWGAAGFLILLLGAMTALGISRTGDSRQVVMALLYYLVFVALTEEFVIRGVCVYLLRDFPWQLRYLLPSFLFAVIHIFAFGGFQPMTWELVRRFFLSECFGLMASGCCFQLLKDWTGTLWVPILIHAMLDFSAVFMM